MAISKVTSSIQFVAQSSLAGGGNRLSGAHWEPNTDVYATDGGLVIKVELAGMRSENLEITVQANRLRISGVRPDCCRASKCSFWVMNIDYGPFETNLELPAGYDLSQAKASYLNGFLRIDVPLAAQPKPKTTTVPIAEAD